MSITQLKYLVALDEYRHFGRAALYCHITQPTLSMQVQKFEDEIDVVIFDRSKNPIIPTMRGEEILIHARKVLGNYEQLFRVAENKEQKTAGSFKLSLIPTIAPSLLPLFLPKFLKKYPEVDLHISQNTTKEIIKLLEEDKIDGGILATPLKNTAIIERPLYYEPFKAMLPPGDKRLKKNTLSAESILKDSLLILKDGHCFRDQMLSFCRSPSQKKNSSHIVFEGESFEILKNLVVVGMGTTLLPLLFINSIYPERKIQSLIRNIEDPVPVREVSLVYSRAYHKEMILNALEEEILQSLPDDLLEKNKKMGAKIYAPKLT